MRDKMKVIKDTKKELEIENHWRISFSMQHP